MTDVSSPKLRRTDARIVNVTFVALLSVGIATLATVQAVPDDVLPAGALVTPSVIMATGLLMPVAVQIRQDLLSLLRVENAMMIGLVYWLLLDMIQAAYPFQAVTAGDVKMAYASVGLFAFAIWFGASGRGWSLPKIIKKASMQELNPRTIFTAIVLAFFLGMAKFLIGSNFNPALMLEAVGNSRWDTPWSRGQFGGAEAILDHLQYFGYLLPALCVLLATRVGWRNFRVLIGISLSLVVILFLAQSGGRRIIGVVVGAAGFTWVASRPRLNSSIILVGSLITAGLLAFMQEMLRYRNVGFSAWLNGEKPELSVDYLHVDDNFLRLSQLIGYYPENLEFVYYKTFFHALTLPIPRVIWPGKPTGPGFDLPALLGFEGVSLSVSIVGELWVSYGLVAVALGGLLLGRICSMWNKILLLPFGTSRALFYGIGLMVLFAGLRSAQAMVQMSYVVIACVVILTMLRKRSRN